MTFHQPQQDPPHGSEMYDLGGTGDIGALDPNQQKQLNAFKVKTRIENERYLREHPELECLLSSFLGEFVQERPEDIRNFAADFFTNPDLSKTVETLLAERQQMMKKNDIIKKIC